jgi:hypothetical protein
MFKKLVFCSPGFSRSVLEQIPEHCTVKCTGKYKIQLGMKQGKNVRWMVLLSSQSFLRSFQTEDLYI